MTEKAGNGSVTYREARELVDRATEKINAEIARQFSDLRSSVMGEIQTLKVEIYGKEKTPGLRQDVDALEARIETVREEVVRGAKIAHTIQFLLSAILAAIGIGVKQ